MEQDKLNKILKQHKLWLDSDGKEGTRADPTRADLSGADLSGADLTRADLRWANLSGTNLTRADLRWANLSGTNLTRANLTEAEGTFAFGPIGSEKRIGYAVKHTDCVMVQLGCFWNTSAEAIKAVREKYGKGSLYEAQIKLAVKILEEEW